MDLLISLFVYFVLLAGIIMVIDMAWVMKKQYYTDVG